MGSPLYHVGALAQCPHLGPVTTVSSNTRVKVSGSAVATMVDLSTIASCGLATGGSPPCTMVQWAVPAARVKVMGSPALLASSQGTCQTAALSPQGLAVILTTQQRVKGA